MRKILSLILLVAGSLLSIPAISQADPVEKANDSNAKKADKKLVNEDVATFLVKSADARMMDAQEGKLAKAKGTTEAIRSYGALMVKDQALLLKQIQKLATARNITLPAAVANEKRDASKELSNDKGKDFDKKFIKMMIIDHERDVKLFRKAVASDDKGISAFAGKYLPMIEDHLAKIEALKETE